MARREDVIVDVVYAWADRGWVGAVQSLSAAPKFLRNLRRSDSVFSGVSIAKANVLAQMLASNNYDIIHAHFSNFPGRVAVELGALLERPVTVTAHAADYLQQPKHRLSATLSRADSVFAISIKTANDLRFGGVPEHKIALARAAVNPDIRPRNAIPTCTRLITVARLVAKKGIDDCIRCAAELRALGLEFRWDIVGDGPERPALAAQIEGASLQDYVFMHGAQEHAKVLDMLRTASLAVLPCRVAQSGDEDGIPVFLLESAAMQVPFVAGNVGGISDLTTGVDGALYSSSNVEELTGRVLALIENPSNAKSLSESLHNNFVQEFSPFLQTDRYIKVWRQLCSRGASDET